MLSFADIELVWRARKSKPPTLADLAGGAPMLKSEDELMLEMLTKAASGAFAEEEDDEMLVRLPKGNETELTAGGKTSYGVLPGDYLSTAPTPYTDTYYESRPEPTPEQRDVNIAASRARDAAGHAGIEAAAGGNRAETDV